jgi:hypothetical protein
MHRISLLPGKRQNDKFGFDVNIIVPDFFFNGILCERYERHSFKTSYSMTMGLDPAYQNAGKVRNTDGIIP